MKSSALAASVRHLRDRMVVQGRREESDQQLLQAFTSEHDEGAFAVLVRRYGPLVLSVCRRVLHHAQDAEDAFQAAFLVLARDAAKLRKKTALASFLYGTAYRLALTARRAAIRRRKHEGSIEALTQPRSPTVPSEELWWREVRSALDEEIAHLSEIYRSVFVLCCLENVSREEAARRLGLKEGTVSSRLTAARKRLSKRLSLRGVELTAVLAASTLAPSSASAVPAGLTAAAIKAAWAMSTGEKGAGVVSPAIAQLVKDTTEATMVGKTKLVTVVLLTASMLTVATSGSLVSWYGRASGPLAATPEPPAAKADDKPKTVPPKCEATKAVEIHGRVLGSDGESKAGAKILLLSENEKIAELGVTAADGRFSISLPNPAKGRLIARTEDAGIDFVSLADWKPGKPVELRLVKDRPIRGQVVTTEGKPVAGARVAVQHIRVYADNSLDSFPIAWANRRGNSEMPGGVKTLWVAEADPFSASTDAEGRFVLRGIGSERVVRLSFIGPGIASTERWVINRDGFDAKPYNRDLLNYSPGKVLWGPWTLISGPEVSIVAEREKIIRGVVKDADTGKGVAGAQVWLMAGGISDKSHELFDGLLALPLKTQADAQGRYEIRGALKAKWYKLQVVKDRAAGYLGNVIRATEALDYQPLTVDLTVRKGVIVTGKIIDKSTGIPVPGLVETAVLNGNPFAKDYPTDSRGFISHAETGSNGTFRDVVVPGPVLLMGDVSSWRLPGGEAEAMGYKKCQPDPKYPKYFQMRPDGDLGYFGLNGDARAFGGNSCKVVDAKPGVGSIHQDLFVERDSARNVKILDAEGKPLRGVWVAGIHSDRNWAVRLNGYSCPVYALETEQPRLMVFYEPSKKLAGSLRLKADEKEPAVAKLAPIGAIRGCLLDTDGKPLAGVVFDVHYRDDAANRVRENVLSGKQAVTDANGKFTIDELIPGLKFELNFRQGKLRFERETKPKDSAFQVKPGECRDLGTLKLKRFLETAEE